MQEKERCASLWVLRDIGGQVLIRSDGFVQYDVSMPSSAPSLERC